MPDQPNDRKWTPDEYAAQRTVMLMVLLDDHDERWSRAELQRELHDTSPHTLAGALERLQQEGLVHLEGELVIASRAARHLDNLGMVCI
jgi:DNA-binding HxlR family transcriptional regulator